MIYQHILILIFFIRIKGFPSELYYYGSGMWESLYGMVTAYPIICFVFIPVYFNLSLTSVYHYLDLRYVRILYFIFVKLISFRFDFNLITNIYI